MSPGTLITNVSHLEEVGIQPCTADGISEKGLVGSWCTGSHNNPVKVVLFDPFFYHFKAVCGAGIHYILGMLHILEPLRHFGHILYINHTGNVYPAMTYKDANSGSFSYHILLFYLFFTG